MKNLLYLLLSFTLLISACDDDDDSFNPETITELYFGTFYGECFGNCTTIYWARDQELRIDTIDYFYDAELLLGDLGAYVLLPDSLYPLAMNLRADFPSQLYNEAETIGIPDAYDQGGYFIAVPEGNGYRSWRIDTNRDAVPAEIHVFLDQVDDAMSALAQ